jgi:acyl-CoA reductase-like NAD-dependent aldehyde dehydrogenase
LEVIIIKALWIDGHSVASRSTASISIVNPATEEVIDEIPAGSETDISLAVAAANHAGIYWRQLGPVGRRGYLLEAAARILEDTDAIARLLTMENGKPLPQAKAEVLGAMATLREYAELVVHYRVGSQGSRGHELSFQRWEPRGVSACIVPWNFPLQVAMETLAPNLAVGNTVVIKPSEKTPLSMERMITHAFHGLPHGVCNLVLGDGPNAGDPLVRHPNVDVVMFVGSVKTGRHIGRICGETTKKAILELGGKDAFIVDKGTNLKSAASLVADSCFANSGQICTSTERVFVHSEIIEQFVEELVNVTTLLRLGNGLDKYVTLGPLIDMAQLSKVSSHVKSAVNAGAKILAGGERLPRSGYFYPPTIVMMADQDSSELMRDETFGPIAPLVPFHSFQEAIELANDSDFGLAAIVYSNNANHVMDAIENLRAGMIKVNTKRGKAPGATSEPFGISGLGHGYGVEVFNELTRQKSIQWIRGDELE